MRATSKVECTLTDRCLTAEPDIVRHAFRLIERGKPCCIARLGEVALTRDEAAEDGDSVGRFPGWDSNSNAPVASSAAA